MAKRRLVAQSRKPTFGDLPDIALQGVAGPNMELPWSGPAADNQ